MTTGPSMQTNQKQIRDILTEMLVFKKKTKKNQKASLSGKFSRDCHILFLDPSVITIEPQTWKLFCILFKFT